MRLVINNLHPRGRWKARSWINGWPSHNHSSEVHTSIAEQLERALACGCEWPSQTARVSLASAHRRAWEFCG
jgi:hypothetical protein